MVLAITPPLLRYLVWNRQVHSLEVASNDHHCHSLRGEEDLRHAMSSEARAYVLSWHSWYRTYVGKFVIGVTHDWRATLVSAPSHTILLRGYLLPVQTCFVEAPLSSQPWK
jgi:hypothetical protein